MFPRIGYSFVRIAGADRGLLQGPYKSFATSPGSGCYARGVNHAADTKDRRGFLSAAIFSLLAVIGAGFGLTALPYLLVPPRRAGQAGWIDAGDLSDLESGVPREIVFVRRRVDGWKVAGEKSNAWVTKRDDGGITAFSPLCTHLGCAYHWDRDSAQFLCPCHGSRFANDGRVIDGPAPRPLDRYEVRVVGNRVWLGPVETQEARQS